ncbi:MAG: OB-fold nucleic acid binding domain-containing protein [Nocardioidaceae bacterium]|jgi:RecG-like helicase
MSSDTGGRLRKAFHKLTATPEELVDDELDEMRVAHDCQAIDRVQDRERVTVYGHVKSVSLAPRAGAPTLEAVLYDGSGVVTLVWLGRRQIIGIKPGAHLMAEGRVSCHDGRRIIYNPRYELQVAA